MARVKSTLAAVACDETAPAGLREKLRDGDWQAVLEAILGLIFNGTEVQALVFSMMQPEHIRANARAVESNRFTREECTLMRQRLLNAAL